MNTANQLPIEIPISKAKLVLLLPGLLFLIPMSYLMILNPEEYTLVNRFKQPGLIRAIGIPGLSLFGIIAVYLVVKLFDKKPGLIIDADGLIDNSSGTSVGRIEWADITEIKTSNIMSNKSILLMTDQPDKYIEKAKNRIAKRAMISNHKMSKSPLSIPVVALKINHDDLKQLLIKHWENYKKVTKYLSSIILACIKV